MLKGIILIVLAAAFWGLGGVAGQYLFQYHQVDAVWLVMVRQIVAGLLFLLYTAVIIRQNIFNILRERFLSLLCFSFVGILGAQLGFYYTISLCNAATATVLQYSAPVWVMIYMSCNHISSARRQHDAFFPGYGQYAGGLERRL